MYVRCMHAAGARDTSEKAAKAITYDPVSDRFPFRIRELERMWARSHGKHAAYTYADVDEQGVIDTLQPRTATPLLTGSGQSPSGVAQARQYSSAANSSSSSSRGQRRAVWGFAAAPFL